MTAVPLLLGLVDCTAQTPDAPQHRRVATASGLDAVVIDTEAHPEGDAEAAALGWAVSQAAILSAYAADHDVLPVALGAAFSGDAALVAHLEGAAPRMEAQRAALAGRAEYVVAVDAHDLPVAATEPGTGNDYLRRRKALRDVRRSRESDRHAFATRVIAALSEAGARLAEPRAGTRNSLVTISALLARVEVATTADRLAALGLEGQRLGLTVRMVGPCAPFSFVSTSVDHD